jgi:hypothetical protein
MTALSALLAVVDLVVMVLASLLWVAIRCGSGRWLDMVD